MIFFLNSTARIYNDVELNKISELLFSDGIFNTLSASHALWRTSGDFLIEASGSNMNVTAKAGSASIAVTSNAKTVQALIQEDTQLSATVASNPSLASRADAVVLRVDQSIITDDDLNAGGTNAVSLVVISGNSATVLTDAEIAIALGGDPFIRLADIQVPLGASAITQAMVTDTRVLSKMTRSVKPAFDILQLYTRDADPKASELERGDIWYNTEDDVLKFFNGTYVQALQLESFDWGYYPPNGLDTNVTNFTPIAENDGSNGGVTSLQISYYTNAPATFMAGEVFTMQADALPNPFIQLKMGAPTVPASLTYAIYTVDASNNPVALKQTLLSLDYTQVPQNDYVNLYLDGSLYTAGVKYMLLVFSTRLGNLNSPPDGSAFYTGAVLAASYAADSIFIGRKQGYYAGTTTNPLTPTWGTLETTSHFMMRIASRDELAFGETDASGNVHKLIQRFTAKSKDIVAFRVIKGTNLGTPTGSLSASLYLADENDDPTGNVLATASIAAAAWTGVSGTNMDFPLYYDQLIVGTRYCVVLDTENYSDTNNYTIYFGNKVGGKAKRFNTVNDYVTLNGDLFYSIKTSGASKIVVTRPDGKIPSELYDYSFDSGVFVKNLADASGLTNVIAHGLGRIPRVVRAKALHVNGIRLSISEGIWTLLNQIQNNVYESSATSTGADNQLGTSSAILRIYGGTGALYHEAVISVTKDNITFTWTKTGAPTGNAQIIWEVS